MASKQGHLELIKYLVIEKGCSLQEMNTAGTCIMNASKYKHIECVVWMLNNGSSLDENTCLTIVNPCKTILQNNGRLKDVEILFKTKSSRK